VKYRVETSALISHFHASRPRKYIFTQAEQKSIEIKRLDKNHAIPWVDRSATQAVGQARPPVVGA
jgi:hypothetical protein